ncbi:MAG: DNA polymerase beta superfamily protein, partial [Nanoarchaeota archaeon]
MYTIEQLREKELIIFEAIMGSRAYGTAMPNSDTDIRGVFIQPLDDVLKYGYVEQVSDETNDTVFYELKRFIELAQTN